MAEFIFFVLNGIFSFIRFALFCYMIMSWLAVFNVINTSNHTLRQIADMLDRFTAPILEPFRRLIPPINGIDISFLFAILIISGIQIYLFPIAETNLQQLIG